MLGVPDWQNPLLLTPHFCYTEYISFYMVKKAHSLLQKWHIIGIAVLLIVTASFIVSRIPKKPELGFSRQLFNPGEFRSTIPNVLDATISRSEKQVEVVVKRENVSLSFQLPIGDTKIKESENLLAFSSPNGEITTEYSMRRDGLKENIILNKIPKENIFPSTLKTEGLITKISAEGIPVFFDKNNKYQFHFERPYVKDATGAVSYAVNYRVVGQEEENTNKTQEQFTSELLSHLKTIEQSGQSYVLQVVVDPTWLHDPKRVLPITIDPTVVHNTSSTFATGTLDNTYDSGSGSSPILASGYQELAADSNTIGLWHMNEASGNVLDSSGNGNTGTPTNTSVVAGVRGNARSFNGTNSGIALASSANANISGDITIEAWINPTSFATTSTLVHKDLQYTIGIQATTGYFAWADSSNWSYANFVYQNIGLRTGVWQHIAVTKSGGVVNVYLDGQLKITKNFGGSLTSTTNTMNVGCYSGVSVCGSAYFNGLIDELRISNSARAPEDIKAAASRRPNATYTSPVIDLGTKATAWSGISWIENGVATGYGETPYSSTGLVAQWNFNERGTATTANYAGTCGAACDATLTGFSNTNGPDLVPGSGWTAQNQRWGAGAIMFDGVDDSVEVADNNSLDLTTQITIEAWVNQTSFAEHGWIISKGAGLDGTGKSYELYTSITTGLPSFRLHDGSTQTSIVSSKPITLGTWNHLVGTFSGGTMNLYLNGVLVANGAFSSTIRSGTEPIIIGRRKSDVSTYQVGTDFNGIIDAIRLYSRALTSNEVISNYNASNIEFQTRVGDTTDPNDGTWEDWKPTTTETSVDSLDSSPLSNCVANGGTTTDGGKTYMFTTADRIVYLGTEVDQKYTVPAGVTSVTVKMWGGGGGGGAAGGWTYGYAGGGGGYTTGTIAVTPGQVLDVMVGAGGVPGYLNYESTTNSYGGGGKNCNSDCRYSGQGGGRSAIRYGGVDLLTAGGGGGGGSTLTTSSNAAGGAGGGTSGAAGSAAASPLAAGGGGTQVAGGAGGNGNLTVGYPGTQYTGGNVLGGSYGGGGGGGWYGGGSGSYHNVTVSQMGGGGGGSGYIGGAGVSAASTTAGSGSTPANTADVDFMGRGWGGAANSTVSGYAGAVIITPNRSMTFTCPTSGEVDVLVVAGGGGGGANMGGGGGGGGVVYKEKYPVIANTPISVSVGYGGAGAPAGIGVHPPGRGTNGGNSTFGTITAIGGGWGGTSHNTLGLGIHYGNSGGSGGGSSGYNNDNVAAGTYGSGAGTLGQGYRGGLQGTQYYSGGGGGAGGPGADGNNRANGGPGIYNDILGIGYYWGGGGGGAGYTITGGNGGVGGGGGGGTGVTYGGSGINPGSGGSGGNTGSQTNMAGGNGGVNTGGGGGGSSHYNFSNPGGNGGSGIVVVRVSKNSTDTTTKMQGSASQKLTIGKTQADINTVGMWHLDETGGTGAYLKNESLHNTTVFSVTGADQTYTVPAGVTSINVKMWGGGGGGGAPGGWTYGYAGGGGGYTSGTIAVTPGQVLTVMVGAGGVSGVLGNQSATESYGGGGRNCVTSDCRYAGQGGGRSAIRYSGVDLLTAGGGGGGGATSATSSDSSGGAGGGVYGQRGWAANNFLTSGGGGWQGAGGVAGVGAAAGATAGTQYTGGHAATGSYGGGGGGGWYGGGGGAYDNVGVAQMGGGGGGSGYISGVGVTDGYTLTGRDTRQAGSNDPANGGAGAGGAASTNGVGGKVVITAVNGATNHGTPTGTSVVNGISGKARYFNGTSDYITIPAGPTTSLDIDSGSVTIEAWIKLNAITANNQRIASRGNTGTQGYSIYVNASGYAHLGGVGGSNFSGTTYLTPGQWHHIVGVTDNANSALYVDGKLDATGNVWVVASNLDFFIGGILNGAAMEQFFGGSIDEVSVTSTAKTAQEVAEIYRAGRNTYSNTSISIADFSTKTTLPFFVAADKPGTYLTVSMGESPYVNYQSDANTSGFWHLDEVMQSTTAIYDFDSFEGGPGSTDDWLTRNSVDPDITSTTSYTGKYSLHMPSGWGQNFENGAGEPATVPYNTNTYPYLCMAYNIPSTTINNMLFYDGASWRSITMTQGESPTSYPKAATWNPLITDRGWHQKCINFDAQLDASLGTGTHNIYAIIWHDGGGQAAITGEFWIDDFVISSQPYYSEPGLIKDSAGKSNGTPIGTVTAPGKIDNARSFNGSTDFILIPATPALDLQTFNISAWVYSDNFTHNGFVFEKTTNGLVNTQYSCFFAASGNLIFRTYNTTPTGDDLTLPISTNFTNSNWHHLVCSYDGTSKKIYVNGKLAATKAYAQTLNTNPAGTAIIGAYGSGTSYFFNGRIDEVRVDSVARTADEIRQAYEVGLRSHSITIDFGAKLDAGNLIANSGDLSFTVDATTYGLNQKGSNIYPEDKIIVRENYDGTEYTAQGTVTSVNPSTGALTVLSWDAGGTFPAGGFTANADVFKWQKEYWNITASQSIHRNAVDLLTLRFTDGNEARTVWIDDLKSNGNYLTNSAGSSIASSLGERYFQYRTIFHSSDESVSANLTSVTLNYNANIAPALPTLDSPVNNATAVSRTPTLQTTTTDINIDYLRYKIEFCTDLAMTTGCQTFDQTSSQTGWSGQNTETNTAYVSGMQASYTISTPLNYNSTYYWRSYAVDPNGTNVWTSTQTVPFSFTTLAVEAASSCKMTRTNDTTNTIEWVDVSANEAGYRIQRNVNNAGWVDLNPSLNPNTVSYVDNTVQLNNSYQYRIASFIAGPQYSTWCTTQTQSINTGILQFGGGFSFSGITIQ